MNSASPAITTTPSVSTVTLGTSSVTLTDTAVLSGGYHETGTITFTLYQGSTLVHTETVSVSGNGTYATPVGYTLPTSGTVTGTYQWNSSYSGDTNNNSASENGAAGEQVTVNPASPGITTTPSVSTVTLGTTSVTLNDTAVLSGGYHETGSITFTLYLGSTLVDTESVSVNGNGTYTTPAGYTLPTSGTVTGTYQWNSSYSGDTNNNSASENNASGEQVIVSPASPAITTTPSVSSVTLGTSSVTMKDTAVLSGGYHETGTITFTLYLGSAPRDTETVSVSGNGSYTTSSGYTLPTSGTVTGTYQWDASFSGDTNNNSSSENNAAAEQVTVNPASPGITTTPSVTTVTLSTSAVTVRDTAVLSGGYHEAGSITFTLYLGGTLVDTETVSVTGNGTYTTPTGYSLSTSVPAGVYQWDASYSGAANNNTASDNNDAAEQVTVFSPCCNLQNIRYSVYNPATMTTTTPEDLSGNTQQGDTITVTFTVPTGDYDQISLVSYNAPEGFYNANDANLQTVFQSVTQAEAPGTHTLSITLPSNFYQIDFVCGTVITTLGPVATNPNNFYHAQNRSIDFDNGGVNPVGSGVLSVTGEVYNDVNADGKLDSGDQAVCNVTVTLTGTDYDGTSISETATTNGSGVYSFSGLPFSNSTGYAVSVSPPSGYSSARPRLAR